jgi:hypothetical protein
MISPCVSSFVLPVPWCAPPAFPVQSIIYISRSHGPRPHSPCNPSYHMYHQVSGGYLSGCHRLRRRADAQAVAGVGEQEWQQERRDIVHGAPLSAAPPHGSAGRRRRQQPRGDTMAGRVRLSVERGRCLSVERGRCLSVERGRCLSVERERFSHRADAHDGGTGARGRSLQPVQRRSRRRLFPLGGPRPKHTGVRRAPGGAVRGAER